MPVVRIWDEGRIKPIEINSDGEIDYNARLAFSRGQCHSLALALNDLTKYPIYVIFDNRDSIRDPSHVCVLSPFGYLDIYGLGAEKRSEQKWGPVSMVKVKPEDCYNFETYLIPDISAAMPFAKTLIQGLNL